MMHDAKHHAPHNGKSEKEANRSDKQPAPRTLGNVLAQKRAKTRAAENKKQCRHRREKNWQKNPVAVHGSLDRDRDASVILRKRSPSLREGLPTKDPCISGRWLRGSGMVLLQPRPLPFRSQVDRRGICLLPAAKQPIPRATLPRCGTGSSNYATTKFPHPGSVAFSMVYNWVEFDASVGGIYETYPRKTGWA
jgi:hypothetical protein